MLWVEMGPPKKDGGVLALSTPVDMTLFGQDLCKDNEVKMRSLIQYNRCPYKRGKIWTQGQAYTENRQCETPENTV